MINSLTIKNFRNHQELNLKFKLPKIYLYGNNGAGKTSILESIYFAATTKSHRTSDEKELIKKNEPFALVKLATNNEKIEIILSKTGKRIFVNGVEKRRISDFLGTINVVLFAPEDLDLIKGTRANRRQFLDLEWMQLNKSYLNYLNQYKNVLKQRNALLKKLNVNDDYTFLDILGQQLYEIGLKIVDERTLFIKLLNDHLVDTYKYFSDNKVKIVYKPDVDSKQFINHINKQQKQDILYQTTLVGPHRDDFYFEFNGFDAKNYASQGEMRLIVIALKLALLEVIKDKNKKEVILLLDDVLSELDKDKQKTFIEKLPNNHQIIMTSVVDINDPKIEKIEVVRRDSYDK